MQHILTQLDVNEFTQHMQQLCSEYKHTFGDLNTVELHDNMLIAYVDNGVVYSEDGSRSVAFIGEQDYGEWYTSTESAYGYYDVDDFDVLRFFSDNDELIAEGPLRDESTWIAAYKAIYAKFGD